MECAALQALCLKRLLFALKLSELFIKLELDVFNSTIALILARDEMLRREDEDGV